MDADAADNSAGRLKKKRARPTVKGHKLRFQHVNSKLPPPSNKQIRLEPEPILHRPRPVTRPRRRGAAKHSSEKAGWEYDGNGVDCNVSHSPLPRATADELWQAKRAQIPEQALNHSSAQRGSRAARGAATKAASGDAQQPKHSGRDSPGGCTRARGAAATQAQEGS